jgi:uncharacterized phage protein (TIGR01671 family)
MEEKMMDIKFRAWDKQAKTMRLVKSINYADDGFAETVMVHLVGGITFGYVHGESCELLQYIGLKDMNEKEIYEGDIVRCWSGNESDELDYRLLIGVVKYQAPYWGVQPQKGYWNHLAWNAEYVEVIGNIYENKELEKSDEKLEKWYEGFEKWETENFCPVCVDSPDTHDGCSVCGRTSSWTKEESENE